MKPPRCLVELRPPLATNASRSAETAKRVLIYTYGGHHSAPPHLIITSLCLASPLSSHLVRLHRQGREQIFSAFIHDAAKGEALDPNAYLLPMSAPQETHLPHRC